MSSDDAAEGFTMKTNWKGKGPADESEDQKRESFSWCLMEIYV